MDSQRALNCYVGGQNLPGKSLWYIELGRSNPTKPEEATRLVNKREKEATTALQYKNSILIV